MGAWGQFCGFSVFRDRGKISEMVNKLKTGQTCIEWPDIRHTREHYANMQFQPKKTKKNRETTNCPQPPVINMWIFFITDGTMFIIYTANATHETQMTCFILLIELSVIPLTYGLVYIWISCSVIIIWNYF